VAERALPPGAIRRRAFFGLLDADGWGWATLKALFWFVVILLLLGYIPDRAYYFTVFPTIDVGANVISPINFCEGRINKNLPCPAPAGAIVPWEESPPELALPEARVAATTVQSGVNLYLIGGQAGDQATDSVLVTQVTTTGNFGRWEEGPALPEPRTDAAVVSFSGVPYVLGGSDASGQATDTVFVGTIEEGLLKGWTENEELKLPRPISGAGGVASGSGIWLLGGRSGEQGSAAVLVASLDQEADPPALKPWQEDASLALPEPRTSAGALLVGSFLYVVGGETPNGITETLLRLRLDNEGAPTADPATGGYWALSSGSQSLPEPRADASVFTSSGAIYVAGGRRADGALARTLYWAVPNATAGTIPEWRQLSQTELPAPRADAAPAVIGSFAFLIGGRTDSGGTDTSLRANLAPKAPFFRLGLLGATLPALSIQGEIGQQLGYLNAFGIGMTNFTILVLLAYAFSHRARSQRFLERVTRGRYRAPREEGYYDPNRPPA
jgi:hypothetical protein